jgi:hypothetical protein
MSRMSAWWSSLGFNRGERRADTDYADMGTAFGLDASFGREGRDDSSVAFGTDRYTQAPGPLESGDGQVSREGAARP